MLQALQLGDGADVPANVRSMDIDFARPLPPPYLVEVTSGWWDNDSHRHPGMDIVAKVGTPTVAMQDGVVITADHEGGGNAGKWVAIQHKHGWVSRYMHHSKVLVRKGDVVRRGQQIGESGNTGLSVGPHLHVDLKLAPEWIPLVHREVGTWGPKGFKAEMGGRFGVPAETWVPADSYRKNVISDAKRNNVMLYAERKKRQATSVAPPGVHLGLWGPILIGLGALGLGAGVYFWLASGSFTSAPYARRR